MLSMISTPGMTGWLGKCPAKKRLVHRDIFHADGRGVQHDIDHPVQHQERVAVRDVVHDPMDIDQLDGLDLRRGAERRLARQACPWSSIHVGV